MVVRRESSRDPRRPRAARRRPAARCSGSDHLQIHEDLDYQRQWWRIQRVGWAVMLCLIAAALAGVFGGMGAMGRVSHAFGTSTLTYDRFLRRQRPTQLVLDLNSLAPSRGDIAVSLPREYLDKLRIQRIEPQPGRVTSSDSQWIFHFDATIENKGGWIRWELEPLRAGSLKGDVVVHGGASFPVSQFVYP